MNEPFRDAAMRVRTHLHLAMLLVSQEEYEAEIKGKPCIFCNSGLPIENCNNYEVE